MCGICGMYNFEKLDSVEIAVIDRMNGVMKHRGPDDQGLYVNHNLGLGQRRLSIIDLASGHQPIFNENRSCCVVLNGEIYNFKDLRTELESMGHCFKTASDTEVIIHAYEQYGTECLERLRGMFAFALWDFKNEILFVARDRLGKKPLYYYVDSKRFIFASEIKAILNSGFVKPEVRVDLIDEYLALGYITSPNTMFKHIMKLDPGYYIFIKQKKWSVRKYWWVERIEIVDRSIEEYKSSMRSLLEESVKYRMISDVPLGAFLSGGLDSSIIVGIMTRLSSSPVRTFSVGYKNQEQFSELKYARKIAQYFATEHHEIILEPVDFYTEIPKMVWHLDEPIADQACIPLWLLSKEAKQHVTVLLSGEGADELFAGYPIYILMKGIELYQRVPQQFRKFVLDPIIMRLFGERKGMKYVEWSRLPLEYRYLGDMADFSNFIRQKLFTKQMYQELQTEKILEKVKDYYSLVARSDSLGKMQFLDLKTWLVDDLLLKADKMTMAASVELRCPFLDHKFVEYSRSIPSNLKLHGLQTKFILKEAYGSFLPRDIVHRKKRGFPVPLSSWFQGDLNKLVEDVLLDKKCQGRGYFDSRFINEIIQKQRNKTEDYSKLLWSLLVLEFWHNVFIDK